MDPNNFVSPDVAVNMCICRDETLKTYIGCLKCENTIERLMTFTERLSICPEHNDSTLYPCAEKQLCAPCTEQGYTICINSKKEYSVEKKD